MNEVLNYLKREPRFRERSAKNRGIADLLIEKYHLDLDRKKLADVIQEASSMDRAWRKCLEENPDLRGSDYEDKQILEEKKMLELNYSPSYEKDVKILKLL